MDSIEDLDIELTEIIEQINGRLNEVGDLTGDARYQELRRLSGLVKSADLRFRTIELEIRELDKAKQEHYTMKRKEFKEQLDFIKESIAAAKSSTNNTSATTNGMIKEGLELQHKDKIKVKEMIATVAAIEATGRDTLITLAENGNQLQRIDKQMNELDSEISMAKKELRKFIIGLAKDKFLRVLMILVILGVLAVTIWAGVKKGIQ